MNVGKMTLTALDVGAPMQPIRALVDSPEQGVLAVIVNIEGPSYRPLGAMMAVFKDKRRVGSLSSGCVEADIALHALEALANGRPKTVHYGRGSSYRDIQLPCGGGMSVLLIPAPDLSVLRDICECHAARKVLTLRIHTDTGALSLIGDTEAAVEEATFVLQINPELRFYVFGKGPEASTFASLVQTMGHAILLLSPDNETLEAAMRVGCNTQHLTNRSFPPDLSVDAYTAIILFFHDHDWEPPILAQALETPAFYIGAQGSRRARDIRLDELRNMGVLETSLERLVGPVGIIPSARDAGTLAVSVLAEVLATFDAKPVGSPKTG